jgi:methionyl aminopeptidase
LKYKKCCLLKGGNERTDIKEVYARKYKIRLKEPRDVQCIREAGRLVVETLKQVEGALRTGLRTDEIDRLVHEFTTKNGARAAPLNYKGFPKSVCVSVNEEVCHGIPGPRILKDGDIVNVDVTSILNGYYADASKTFWVGEPGPEARKIVSVARECLKRGIEQVRPGNTIGDIGWAIQQYAESRGCSVVRDYVGHGVGFEFHEQPQVPHFGRKGTGVSLVPGMVFTIEPMINLGGWQLKVLEDGWTAVTSDGSLSAQFEQTILVVEDGWESLTSYEL